MRRLVAVACGLVGCAAAIAQPMQLERVPVREGATASRLRAQLDQHDVKVIAVSRFALGDAVADATLQRVGGALLKTRREPFALVSGGFNREDPLDPSGALVENRRSMAPLSLARRTVDGRGAVYRLSGVLCVSSAGAPRIVTVDEFQRARAACAWALQAGPIVVERNGTQAINPSEKSTSSRLVACEPKDQPRAFDFYYFSAASLATVETTLKPVCATALNLAGSMQAGITLWEGGGLKSRVGQTGTALPSMIVVTVRKP